LKEFRDFSSASRNFKARFRAGGDPMVNGLSRRAGIRGCYLRVTGVTLRLHRLPSLDYTDESLRELEGALQLGARDAAG
jgi:hypothetical protein